jgi:hypothetical protein
MTEIARREWQHLDQLSDKQVGSLLTDMLGDEKDGSKSCWFIRAMGAAAPEKPANGRNLACPE